jgi:RNA polymerase-binding transcription factor DksA
MVLGQQNALIIDFPDVDDNFISKEWRNFTNNYGNLKKVKKSNEYVLADIQVVDIGGASRIDVYSSVEKSGKTSSRMMIWVDSGNGVLSSESDPEGYAGSVKLLQDFAHHVKVVEVQNELEEQKKELDKMGRELEKLQKENERYHKTIEKAKETIAKNEDNIVRNEQDQTLTQKEIEAQNLILKEIEERLEKIKSEDPGKTDE